MNIYMNGMIYEAVEVRDKTLPVNYATLYNTTYSVRFQVIGSHTFKEGQEVVEGKDYEKQYQYYGIGNTVATNEWRNCSKQYYDTEYKDDRRIVALPLAQPVQHVEEKDKDGWVRVEDGLPEMGQEVIVYCPKSSKKVTALCRFNRYEEDVKFYWDNFYGGSFTHIQEAVTHWMKLPPPPKN